MKLYIQKSLESDEKCTPIKNTHLYSNCGILRVTLLVLYSHRVQTIDRLDKQREIGLFGYFRRVLHGPGTFSYHLLQLCHFQVFVL